MRYVGLLLASLLAIGCGNPGMGNHDPGSIVQSFSPPSITVLTPGQRARLHCAFHYDHQRQQLRD
jgi:hypothetical protein